MRFFSCVLIPIFCFCLFLGLIVLFIIREKNIDFKSLTNATKTNPTSIETNGVLKKIESEPNGNQAKITLNENDLNILANEYLKGNLSSPETKIYSDKITLKGTLDNFFSRKALISILPKVTDNKLSVEITDMKVGFVPAPKFLKNGISALINKNIEQKVNTRNSIDNILLENGRMTVILKEIKE